MLKTTIGVSYFIASASGLWPHLQLDIALTYHTENPGAWVNPLAPLEMHQSAGGPGRIITRPIFST